MSDFWIKSPCELFKTELIPKSSMKLSHKLNILTRITILVSVIAFAVGVETKYWLSFLLLSLLSIIAVYYSKKKSEERFTVVPTYNSNDFHQTTVSPLFAEEWQIPPPAYDLIESEQPPYTPVEFDDMEPQSYPYGQYLTKTNLIPADEYKVRTMGSSSKQAKDYINSSFLRHDLSFRDNMSRILKLKLAKRFKHNCNDTFSPYNSY